MIDESFIVAKAGKIYLNPAFTIILIFLGFIYMAGKSKKLKTAGSPLNLLYMQFIVYLFL